MKKKINSENIHRILIIQTAFLGDVALTLYLAEAIKQNLPNTEIYFLSTPAAAPIARLSCSISQVIEFDKRNKNKGLKGIKKLSMQINSMNIDCVIAPHGSLRTSLLAHRINAPIKIGYNINSLSSLVYNYRVEYHQSIHEIDRLFSLLEMFDIDTSQIKKENIFPNLHFSEADINGLNTILIENNIFLKENISKIQNEEKQLKNSANLRTSNIIAVAPGSVWKTKRWSQESFANLIAILQENNYQPVLIGGKEDLEICNEIQKSTNCKSLVGKTTLGQVILFLKYSMLTITNDSAPTHFSDIVGTPVAAIFGPTSPIFGFAPFRKNDIIIENEELECHPCEIHGSDRCPLNTHQCMKSISPENVYERISPLLEKNDKENNF